ncbi:PREDICTED: UDP-glycosyltransferase 73B3-like isoform X4 [Brassica oleracea var. oleracea]|uniref:UDP-glycosyltransferase 73B3-like isoform X4 n=1 Tax=Brassica oleracea var. oleracea TaxID=109376 RepID=UPI0006A71C15|nr:PREDICTED: UDP-glycosyltransferase 73B3-like isoform X4 [Brassica oleracea var. oleracea]
MPKMSSDSHKLHVMFFPFMGYGHMIPTLDMAKLFSSRGAKSTIITTPLNAKILQKPINTFKSLNPSLKIEILIIDFPCVQLGLPEGCENPDFFTSNNNSDERQTMMLKFFASMRFFKDQLEKILETTRPSCLIADMFFPWATEAAEKFNVPRLVFHGTGYFSLCSEHCIRRMHKPKKSCEPFKVPDLPGDEILVTQVLKTGVSVGTKKHASMGDFVSRESVEKAVGEVLVGEEAEERRRRAMKLAEMAKSAVEGGSSYNDLSNFIEEFSS